MTDTKTLQPTLILASGSPRRFELLTALQIPFVVAVSDAEEHDTLPEAQLLAVLPPVSVALHDHPTIRAWRKGYHVAQSYDESCVLAADTIVVIDGQVLNKPIDALDAHRMLRMLSGKTHQVYTGMALFMPHRLPILHVCVSHVTMQSLTDDHIAAYVATGESLDKAGAYGIQGMAGTLVTAVEGSFTNVVGLPLLDTVQVLAHVNITPGCSAETAYQHWRGQMYYTQIPHGSYL
ncbi:MAG: Maf family protein [Chloroflexota bacterium]|jgi:septum formation protein